MKHIFIINPAAGKGKAGKIFLPDIIETAKAMKIDYEIHRTLNAGDAERFIKNRCNRRTDQSEAIRFYGCGGDGTLNEVVNGAYGFSNVEIAMIPAGTGNDFVRNFNHSNSFYNIQKQVQGTAFPIDVMRYESLGDEPRYCINMFNIGFDSDVALKIDSLRKHPFFVGSFAYGAGVGMVLAKKQCIDIDIEFDDGTTHQGEILLIAIANGSYCGGGFKALPQAQYNDSLIDIGIIENMSRLRLIRLLKHYKRGTHLNLREAKDIVFYRQCKNLKIKSKTKMKLCTDGEISMVDNVEILIVPKSIMFSIPK